ncbi:MAG: hypothetical protein WCJ72_00535 [Chryseobacterium sp.]|jgi:hypothetical protein
MSKNKIQCLIVEHLLKHGQIELFLPDNVTLEIGITQESQSGKFIKKDNYCWVMASRDDRTACLDSFNLGLRFADEKNALILDDSFINQDGEQVRRLDVV